MRVHGKEAEINIIKKAEERENKARIEMEIGSVVASVTFFLDFP